jgi:hypothetical protein
VTFFDELGLRAAEQLETSVGPFIALASFKRLLAAEQPTRGRAVIGALRCAMALDEEGEIERAVAAFEALDGDTISAVTYAVRLLDSGRTQLAARLCAAELSRTGSSTAAYVRARAVEAGLDAGLDSCALWGQVVEHAGARGDHRVHAHAVARWIGAWITRARRDAGAVLPRAALVAHAERAQLAEVLAEERLVILRGRLLSASAFQRASASSSLEEIARRDTAGLGGAALAMLCRHFDEMPFHLHSIEVDRVRAALKRLPDGADKTRLFEGIDAMAALASAYAAREDDASIEAAASRVARASPLAAAASARRAAAATASEPLPSLLAGAGAYESDRRDVDRRAGVPRGWARGRGRRPARRGDRALVARRPRPDVCLASRERRARRPRRGGEAGWGGADSGCSCAHHEPATASAHGAGGSAREGRRRRRRARGPRRGDPACASRLRASLRPRSGARSPMRRWRPVTAAERSRSSAGRRGYSVRRERR